MCGILGYISGSERPAVALNLGDLAHRGPDAHGQWWSPERRIWFGHTRLAILDLSKAGDQPMVDGTNVLVFNGEIYNHLELRRELLAFGINFFGGSDTETILRGYRVWGSTFFDRLEGMFSFAIYNTRNRSVTLCRDRYGIKPLYFARTQDGSLAFSSEVRSLFSVARKSISQAGLAAYLHWGACSHHQLLFENIREFPAGCWAEVHEEKRLVEPCRYWPIQPTKKTHLREKTENKNPVSSMRSLLEDAVRRHLLADVPVACLLSGGLDSSALVALAARELGGEKLATFSMGFSEREYDESHLAKLVSKQYRTNHHHIQLSESDQLNCIEAGVAAMDLPSIDALNTYIVSSYVAGAGYKVVLSGLGADEIFGGYPIFRHLWCLRCITAVPAPLRRLIMLTGKGWHLLGDVPKEKSGEALSCWWRRIWSGPLLERYGITPPDLIFDPSPPLCDTMAELSWGELSHYMRDMLLRDADVMSMAHSLEMRVPFLDNRLVSHVLATPSREKSDPQVYKPLLLSAVKDLLPKEIWNRQKMGFSLPMRKWMLGVLRNYSQAGLDYIVEEGVFNKTQVSELWVAFERQKIHWSIAWAIIVLGHYLKKIR